MADTLYRLRLCLCMALAAIRNGVGLTSFFLVAMILIDAFLSRFSCSFGAKTFS